MKKLALMALLVSGVSLSNALSQETVSLRSPEATSESIPDFINHLHQRQWVRLSESGTIEGRVSVVLPNGDVEGRVGAKIVVSRDGSMLHETVAGSDGEFKLQGIEPGTYALQTRGDYTFSAFALHVLPSEASGLDSTLDVYASVIAADRVSMLLAENIVPGDLEGSDDVYYRSFTEDPLAAHRKFGNSHQVALQNGTLVGRVSRPGWSFSEQDLRGTIAQIVQDGEVVARAAVEQDGFFRVEDFTPGVYDLFVAGDDGVAVVSFEAISGQGIAKSSTGSTQFVATQSGMVSNTLCCEMVQQPEIMSYSTEAPMIVDQGVPADMGTPVVGGGFAGPGGFGGGGFGGGGGGGFGGGGIGGLGGLLGIAGLAAGIVALSDDDSATVGTPIVP